MSYEKILIDYFAHAPKKCVKELKEYSDQTNAELLKNVEEWVNEFNNSARLYVMSKRKKALINKIQSAIKKAKTLR